MRYREQLNIIFMRDNGPRRSLRIRRSRFYLLIIFFASLPFLCILLSIQCWLLWEDNQKLHESVERFESDCQAAEARAERLENLEEFLREENVPARGVLVRQLARDASQDIIPPAQPREQQSAPPPPRETNENGSIQAKVETEVQEKPELADGPGHEEFPAIDTGRVTVSNVQARAMRGNSLRIGLDLRNPENGTLLIGEVDATLVTASGEKHELVFAPHNVGSFRINRFKRTVMVAHVPREVNLADSQIILEVKNQDGEIIYSNIFAVQQ